MGPQMSGLRAKILPGDRLHLHHGPIDLIIGAEGARAPVFAAAKARFDGLLEELVAELPALRAPLDGTPLGGPIARRMVAAIAPHEGFITPMAAVAGAVADEVLAAMLAAAPLRRAYVNNGGDIAVHLGLGEVFRLAMAAHQGSVLGCIELPQASPVRGIATSGRAGRSQSLGIADSVTVLAENAAAADAAATLIANAVDLPGHPAITRCPAVELDPDSDLGTRPVVADVGVLSASEVAAALETGLRRAEAMRAAGLIQSAALFLHGAVRLAGSVPLNSPEREVLHA